MTQLGVKNEASFLAWLKGKLMVAMLMEVLIASSFFSPVAISRKERIVWREYKLAYMIIKTGVVELFTLVADFDNVSYRLRVESRKGKRCRMQSVNLLSS